MELQREDGVFVLHMRDGENRLNRSFLDGVNGALDEVEASQGEAALVTTGEGRFYSTGLDLGWLATCGQAEIEAFLADMHRLFARVLGFPVATVAAINGHAFAAGAMFSLAHDFRVMRSDKGFVCLPEIDLRMGQPLTPGMYALLGARLPRSTLHEALVTGKRYDGPDATAAGFVNEACEEVEVLPRAIEIAGALASKDRATMAAIKRGLYASAIEILQGALPEGLVPDA
ncbi:MAG: enoyl-CoA hydratase/isomerase family protein [Dehalococcoidia bacterium]